MLSEVREAKDRGPPKREHISTHQYLKVSLLQVAGLSLMSSTVKVIWIRFSWPPEGLSLTRTSRETMGFSLSSPASRSSLWATWIVPVTKKAEVRGQMKDKGARNTGSPGMTVLEWWLVYPGYSPIQTRLSVKWCVLLCLTLLDIWLDPALKPGWTPGWALGTALSTADRTGG